MSKLRYFSTRAVEALRKSVGTRLAWYYAPSGEYPPLEGVENPVRETHIGAVDLAASLSIDSGDPSRSDAQNAVTVYRSIPELRPQEAADERLWAHICHTQCAEYVAHRWLGARSEDDERDMRKVRNHFFARENRAIIRDNGMSRLWWLGYIADQVDKRALEEFLEILMHRQDIRSALIERPSVSMNPYVLKAVYRVMKREWDVDREKSQLFKRKAFRDWMILLNRRGGVVFLDALSDKKLDKLVSEEAAEACR